MADRIDELTRRVALLERKVDHLYTSFDQRMDQVDAALFEQRLYMEFACERLTTRLDAGILRVCQRLAQPFEATAPAAAAARADGDPS